MAVAPIRKLGIILNALSRYAHDHLRDPQTAVAKEEAQVIQECEREIHASIALIADAPINQETTPILDRSVDESNESYEASAALMPQVVPDPPKKPKRGIKPTPKD